MPPLRTLALCAGVTLGLMALLATLGVGLGFALLTFAEGDGRAAPFVVLGFAPIIGAGLGLLAGVIWSVSRMSGPAFPAGKPLLPHAALPTRRHPGLDPGSSRAPQCT